MLPILILHYYLDIDECTIGTDCSINSTCTNTDGSYDCVCNLGFSHTLGDETHCEGTFKVILFSIYNNQWNLVALFFLICCIYNISLKIY